MIPQPPKGITSSMITPAAMSQRGGSCQRAGTVQSLALATAPISLTGVAGQVIGAREPRPSVLLLQLIVQFIVVPKLISLILTQMA